ncbi:hypothetical protein PR003_g28273 [Phytophthora rubi]|uniref:Uncharacterized protein n=1 Tax=Phytophthora rubi TaxID=129364 RepID=A0A6A3IJX9_9STRA|nr:hypothetical protein PR001_g23760 [Phytophthora rubi]KAE9279279.1 hypothetical protein PR003_g28273 [Phytophthora rubi]
MTKRQGSSNYTTSEMKFLLALVQSYLPASKRDWDLVAAAYNTRKEPRWKPRNAVSLTRKYRNMCLVSNKVETELACTIRRVQTMMKTPQTRAANPISAAVISGSTSVHAAALTSFDVVPPSSAPSRSGVQESAGDEVRLYEWVEEVAAPHLDCEGSGIVTVSQRLQTLSKQLTTERGEVHRKHREIIQRISSLKVTLDCLVMQTSSIYQQLQ